MARLKELNNPEKVVELMAEAIKEDMKKYDLSCAEVLAIWQIGVKRYTKTLGFKEEEKTNKHEKHT
tara:strand:- start:14669 stop:14866 length:198 start_codon:yes stop_codon:yes gene_type:complete